MINGVEINPDKNVVYEKRVFQAKLNEQKPIRQVLVQNLQCSTDYVANEVFVRIGQCVSSEQPGLESLEINN